MKTRVMNMQNKSIWRQEVHWKVSELCLLGGSTAVWLIGMACNITVRLVNSGKMPVTTYPLVTLRLVKPRHTSRLLSNRPGYLSFGTASPWERT